MVVIKVFDNKGVKTVELLGNANEQPYDEDLCLLDEEECEPTSEPAEED